MARQSRIPTFPPSVKKEKNSRTPPVGHRICELLPPTFLLVPPTSLGGTLGGTVHTVSAKCTVFSPDCYTVMIGFDFPLL